MGTINRQTPFFYRIFFIMQMFLFKFSSLHRTTSQNVTFTQTRDSWVCAILKLTKTYNQTSSWKTWTSFCMVAWLSYLRTHLSSFLLWAHHLLLIFQETNEKNIFYPPSATGNICPSVKCGHTGYMQRCREYCRNVRLLTNYSKLSS